MLVDIWIDLETDCAYKCIENDFFLTELFLTMKGFERFLTGGIKENILNHHWMFSRFLHFSYVCKIDVFCKKKCESN